MSALNVEGLSYSYGRKQALRDVSFSLEAGQFCALLGPNGAGKSTLFSLLTHLQAVQTGRLALAGFDLRSDPRKALARLGIVFQQPTLDLDLSVWRNMTYFAALHGLSGKQAAGRIEAALDRLDMAERKAEKVRALNGGHRRRMEIARALIHDPQVLLLDEPTVGLDAASRDAITRHAHDLAAEGVTVLWATHLTDEVRPTDELILLHKGEVLERGTAAQICGALPLAEVFMCKVGQPI